MWHIASVVFLKEIKSVFASRRMLVSIAIVPLLMFPGATLLVRYLVSTEASMTEEAVIGVVDDEVKHLYEDVIPAGWTIRPVLTDGRQLVQAGLLDAVLALQGANNGFAAIDILYAADSTKSLMVASTLATLAESINETQLASRGVIIPDAAVVASLVNVAQGENAELGVFLASLAGTLVAVCCLTGASSLANSVTVVERERGTMEALYATGANRQGIMVGKLAAVCAASLFAGCCSIVGMLLTDALYVHSFTVGVRQILAIMLGVVCASLVSSSLLVFVGQISKTIREAQTISSVITIISMAPLYLTSSVVVGREPVSYWLVPALNTSCLVMRAVKGIEINPWEMAIMGGSTFFIVVLCTVLGVRASYSSIK